MPLRLNDKKAIVEAVNGVASDALSAVIADYRGLSVEDLTTLRKEARESGVYLRVVRNTLAKKAVEGTDFECLKDSLVGPTILAFSQEDPGSAARLFKKYAKQYEQLEVKALSVGGLVYGASDIDVLATLPTYEEALAKLMGTMLAPVEKLARTINEVPGKLVRTVAAIKEQKEESA